ncbi:hypothetical protein BH23BAC1_BH23BAC1_07520 [soil metagenome]
MTTKLLSLGPVNQTDRIQSVDVIRGIALLGILLMNIAGMGLPFAYSNPANAGGNTGINLQVWEMNELFFEGTMRGLFTMLFGAGMVLLTLRGEEKGGGLKVADIYYRRLLWLLLFGVIHAYIFLWYGEILFSYALLGLMLFPLRKTRPLPLLSAGVILLICGSFIGINRYNDALSIKEQASFATKLKQEGKALSEEQESNIKAWTSQLEDFEKKPEQIKEEIQQRTGS